MIHVDCQAFLGNQNWDPRKGAISAVMRNFNSDKIPANISVQWWINKDKKYVKESAVINASTDEFSMSCAAGIATVNTDSTVCLSAL